MMRTIKLTVLAGLLIFACKPKPGPEPTPADTTVTDTTKADTAAMDSTDVNDSVVTLTAADTLPAPRGFRRAGPVTLSYGMYNTPKEQWGKYNMNTIVAGVQPKYLMAQLRAMDSYGMSIFVNFPNSRMRNSNGTWNLTKCIDLGNEYAQYAKPDSLRKYVAKGVLKGFISGDDFTSLTAWGGKTISQADEAKCVANAAAKFGSDIPIGVRTVMSWILQYNGWNKKLHFGWAQYKTTKGDVSNYFNGNAKLAKDNGYAMVGGLNSHNCYKGTGTGPCKDYQILQWLPYPIKNDVYCAVVSWRWDDNDWRNSGFRNAMIDMGQLAKNRPAASCARPG